MLPVGYLMIEHRLIERMIKLMTEELQIARRQRQVDSSFIETAVDFLKIYADKCHHGKEEDILFRQLNPKPLLEPDRKAMERLLMEHILSRENVKKLAKGNIDYSAGNQNALNEMIAAMEVLTDLYPQHIEKEDKQFFIPCSNYFSDEENEQMLKDFEGFDSELGPVQEKYKAVVAKCEKEKNPENL